MLSRTLQRKSNVKWLFKTKEWLWLVITDVSPAIVRLALDKRQQVMQEGMKNEHCQVGGPGIIVEIDECKFGKRKYHRGHRVEGNCAKT